MRFLILWAVLVIAISAAPKSLARSLEKRSKNSNKIIQQAEKLRRQTNVREMIINQIDRLRKRLRPKSRLKRAHRGKRGKVGKNRQKLAQKGLRRYTGSNSARQAKERDGKERHHQVHHNHSNNHHHQKRPVRGAGKRHHKRRNYTPTTNGMGKLNMNKLNDRRAPKSSRARVIAERGVTGFGNIKPASDRGANMRNCFGSPLSVLDQLSMGPCSHSQHFGS